MTLILLRTTTTTKKNNKNNNKNNNNNNSPSSGMASDCARVYERVEAAKETGFLNLSECKLTQIPNGVFMVMKSSRDPDVDPPITRLSLAKNALKVDSIFRCVLTSL